MWSVPQALATLTLVAFAAVAVWVIAAVGERVFSFNVPGRLPGIERVWTQCQDSALGIACMVALIASLGSLYLSEIANYPPCTLCWLQRIAMYPLVVILGLGALREDHAVGWYALPLAGIGAAVAFYHTLVQRMPSLQQATSCSAEAPCNAMWVSEYGFVSIPVMALGAFLLIGVFLLVDAMSFAGEDVGD